MTAMLELLLSGGRPLCLRQRSYPVIQAGVCVCKNEIEIRAVFIRSDLQHVCMLDGMSSLPMLYHDLTSRNHRGRPWLQSTNVCD